jgi:hypothetical protein
MVEVYLSMLINEKDGRRRNVLLELLMQEQLKLQALALRSRSDQDN